MNTKFSATPLLLLAALSLSLAIAVALSSKSAPTLLVHAFAPIRKHARTHNTDSNSKSRTTRTTHGNIQHNTRLFESIVEAEDRYLEQATNQALSSSRELPDVVYAVVYNAGTPDEGIHTMKYPRGTDEDVLLCFEGMADCILFARTIKEDPALDQEPVPTPTSREMIEQACKGMGMRMEIVPMESESKTQW